MMRAAVYALMAITVLTGCGASMPDNERGNLVTAYMLGVFMGKERLADATAAVALLVPQVAANDLFIATFRAEALYIGPSKTIYTRSRLDARTCRGLGMLFHEMKHSVQHQRKLCDGSPHDCEPPAYAGQTAFEAECEG